MSFNQMQIIITSNRVIFHFHNIGLCNNMQVFLWQVKQSKIVNHFLLEYLKFWTQFNHLKLCFSVELKNVRIKGNNHKHPGYLSNNLPREKESLNPFPNKPWFLPVCRTSLLKTLWEKEKLLVTSNFSFSHSVFYPFGEHSVTVIKSKIFICTLFLFIRV